MQIGQTVGRWTLVSIEAGNICHFKDPDGRLYPIMIGSGR